MGCSDVVICVVYMFRTAVFAIFHHHLSTVAILFTGYHVQFMNSLLFLLVLSFMKYWFYDINLS